MKKAIAHITALVLAVSLILTMFTACGEDKTHGLKKSDPVSITLWHYYNGPQQQAFDSLVSKFNDTLGKEMGILVQASAQGTVNELIDKAMDSLDQEVGAESFPDIIAAYADTAYTINSRGMAADISQYLTEEEQNSYVEEYLEEGKFSEESGIQLFPIAKATEVLMLNETDWAAFSAASGATEEALSTWEGIVTTAEKYYNYTDALTPDVPDDGKAFFGRDAVANYLLVGSMQLGEEVFQVKDGKVTFHMDPEIFKRLWDNYYVPYINGWFTASGRFRSDDAKTGELLAFVGSTSGAMYFPTQVTREDATVYDITCKVLPLPNFEGTQPYAVQQGAGMLVTKSEEKKEYAATVFLKWFTEEENNLAFCLGSGYLPVKKEANSVEQIKKALSDEEDGNSILRQTVENSDLFTENSALYQTLTIGVEMVNDYTLYTNKAFENGTKARNLLSDSLTEKLEEDLNQIQKLVDGGMSRSEAAAQYATDENFESWYHTLQQGLEELK